MCIKLNQIYNDLNAKTEYSRNKKKNCEFRGQIINSSSKYTKHRCQHTGETKCTGTTH